jgi:hypothetical protein
MARDIGGGMLLTLWPGLRFFHRVRRTYDRVVVVGDMIGVYGCFFGGIRNIVYLDVYKNGFGRPYLAIDRFILKRAASVVFCRSDALAQSLRVSGIDARHAGNVMIDTIPRESRTLPRQKPLALAVLPGSRTHALANFAIQCAAIDRLSEKPDVFVAVARGLSLPPRSDMTFVPGSALGDVLEAADVVLSQAGTATVQAIGLGKPVITFKAPQDREQRFNDESRLFGEARQVVQADPAAIADQLRTLLADPAERTRLGAIGKTRVGAPGAIAAILAAI